MAWLRQVGGRLKSDYRYSNKLVYNNYPWPLDATEAQREVVEKAAQAVLDARAQFPDSTLADLYDPVAMPPALAKAHAALDLAVDRCYRKEPFNSDREAGGASFCALRKTHRATGRNAEEKPKIQILNHYADSSRHLENRGKANRSKPHQARQRTRS